jgi:hypothetical protein
MAESSGADQRAKFDDLRSKYRTAKQKLDEHDSAMRARYGGKYEVAWLRVGERRTLERLRDAVDRAGTAFFAHLQAISPRDWSYGVPTHWLYEDLSFEDATRPADERLSIVPPLSYGSTVPRT